MRFRHSLYLALLFLVLMDMTEIGAVTFSNTGMKVILDNLLGVGNIDLEIYPVYNVLPNSPSIDKAMNNLRFAVSLSNNSPPMLWSYGRAAIISGDFETALHSLEHITAHAQYNQLLYRDLLMTLSWSGKTEELLSFFEKNPPIHPTKALSDTIAFAYLEQGGDDSLERVSKLRPGDLHANYGLWKQAEASGNRSKARYYRNALLYFPIEAINPVDERLLSYSVEVIPALWEEGIWDYDKTLNVVSFLVWNHARNSCVEGMLKSLIEHSPANPDWKFYLAELHHRAGNLDKARNLYKHVLDIDEEFLRSYLRLGIINEAVGGALIESFNWYAVYSESNPDDLFALRRLAGICSEMDTSSIDRENCLDYLHSILKNNESTYFDDVMTNQAKLNDGIVNDNTLIAGFLEIPTDAVLLGPNIIDNGDFEREAGSGFLAWDWSAMFNKEPFNAAVFYAGSDSLISQDQTARIDGIWIKQEPHYSPARAGFSQKKVNILARTPYIVSFDYRTFGTQDYDSASMWLSYTPSVMWAGDHRLPNTNGDWKHFVALCWNQSYSDAIVRPLIRSFSTGSVEFDNIQLRLLEDPSAVKIKSDCYFTIWPHD